jgi:hypothetical protein
VSLLDDTITATSIGGLPIRKAAQANPRLNILFYGPYGAGKTLLAGSSDEVPEMRKVLFLDIEGGTFTLQHKFGNTDVLRITNWNQMQGIYDELKAGLHTEYQTIVVDSLTEAQVFNLDEVMRQLVALKPDRNEDIPDIREWQINQKQTKKFVRLFRDLPATVIMTALMKEEKDKQSSKVVRGPDLPGKLAGQIPALFDEVFYLYVKKMELPGDEEPRSHRLLLTGATEDTRAKDRSGRLPQVIADPTMKIIWNLMLGKEEA